MSQNQPKSLQQFIELQRVQYGTQKGIQATTEYMVIINPYIQQIIALEKEKKELLEKLPKKQRVRIIQKGKK